MRSMYLMFWKIIGLVFVALGSQLTIQDLAAQSVTNWVDPFIGTSGTGNTYPGAQAPFGMISISPNSVFEDYKSLTSYESRSGYDYYCDRISGFSLTHFSGIGCHAMQDLPITFTSLPALHSPVDNKHEYAHSYLKSEEQANPGFYAVRLDNGMRVETTTSIRSGLFRVENSNQSTLNFILNPNGAANGITDSYMIFDSSLLLLKGWARTGGFCDRNPENHPYTIYFAIQFSVNPNKRKVWKDNKLVPFLKEEKGLVAAHFDFGNSQGLLVKVGISYVSTDNAFQNLLSELADYSFDELKHQTAQQWEKHLSTVMIEDTNKDDRRKQFYTALYHNMLQPNIFQDINGEYIGFDDKVHMAPVGRDIYTNFSLWDTYRTSVQLQTLLFPERVSDMVQSLLTFTKQSHGGLPVWALNNTDNGVMNGYAAIPFIANAYAYGARDFDLFQAVELIKRAAMEEIPIKDGRGWEELSIYKEVGYLPQDIVEKYSVSKMLEYSVADYSLAMLCNATKDSIGYQYFLDRSKQVFRVFNQESGYFQPKLSDGRWMQPFNVGSTVGFNEGNAGQYNFSITHHWSDFVTMFGGIEQIKDRLDQFFSVVFCEGWHVKQPHFWIGNEPSFGAHFHYGRLGHSAVTSALNEKVLACFSTEPNGLPGNDDSGALSALFVFCALGAYPSYPAEAKFDKIAPVFKQVTFRSDFWRLLYR